MASEISAWTELVPRCDGSGSATFAFHCLEGSCSSNDVLEAYFWFASSESEAKLVGYYIGPEGSAEGNDLYLVKKAATDATDVTETGSFWVELPAGAVTFGSPYKQFARVRNRAGAEYNTYAMDSDLYPTVLFCPTAAAQTALATPSPTPAQTPNATLAAEAAGMPADNGAGNPGGTDTAMVESRGTATGKARATGVGAVVLALLALLFVVALLWVALVTFIRKHGRRSRRGSGRSSGKRGGYRVTDAYDKEEDEFAFAYTEAGDDASPKSLNNSAPDKRTSGRILEASRSFSVAVSEQRDRVLASTGTRSDFAAPQIVHSGNGLGDGS